MNNFVASRVERFKQSSCEIFQYFELAFCVVNVTEGCREHLLGKKPKVSKQQLPLILRNGFPIIMAYFNGMFQDMQNFLYL